MVTEVEQKRATLFGPLKGPKLAQFHRDVAWNAVLDCVNAVAPVRRSLEDIKNKFRDLKHRTKQKAITFKREARKTGGGENEAPPLSDVDLKVVSFIGEESIEGIHGGIDTYREQGKYILSY